MKRPFSGLTLIEVLVVIAVVLVFASIILVNVTQTKNKGKNVGILENMKQFQGTALLIYQEEKAFQKDYGGSLVDVCNWPTSLNDKLQSILTELATFVVGSTSIYSGSGVLCNVSTSGQQFILSAPSKGGTYLCVDGEGNIQELTALEAGGLSSQSDADGAGFTCNPSD